MPISIRWNNREDQECVIRPTPLMTINNNVLKNKDGNFGKTYTITLNGYLLVDQGFPLAYDSVAEKLFDIYADPPATGYVDAIANAGPRVDSQACPGTKTFTFDTTQSHAYDPVTNCVEKPKSQYVPHEKALDALLSKQSTIRALFSKDGQRMEISPITFDAASIVIYPRVLDVSFTEGIYTDRCQYTIVLEADTLLNKYYQVDVDGNPLLNSPKHMGDELCENMKEVEILKESGRFIESYSDGWTLEVDDNLGESSDLTKSYRITRNISAVGKDHYGPLEVDANFETERHHFLDKPNEKHRGRMKAWEQARDFVQFKLNLDYNGTPLPPPLNSSGINVSGQYPNISWPIPKIGSGIINLIDKYKGYNHTRTENISIDGGSYSVTENWLLASGSAYENYNMSITSSQDNPFVNVSINGEIKGLSSISPSGIMFGGNSDSGNRAFDNALKKYYDVSSSGKFGIGSDIYKRANNTVAVQLNAQPKSLSIALNEYLGDITYSLNFDNRPTNIISGVLTESINVNDTYPGDVFAVIPVIGRATGPVLQNIGGRTEYKRNLTIDLLLDYTDIPYGSGRRSLLLQKPSVIEPTKTQLKELIKELSPEFEPGIRKWFISPPSETWSPKEGRYSFNIDWTYELDR